MAREGVGASLVSAIGNQSLLPLRRLQTARAIYYILFYHITDNPFPHRPNNGSVFTGAVEMPRVIRGDDLDRDVVMVRTYFISLDSIAPLDHKNSERKSCITTTTWTSRSCFLVPWPSIESLLLLVVAVDSQVFWKLYFILLWTKEPLLYRIEKKPAVALDWVNLK